MDKQRRPLLQFPCVYPLKVIGKNLERYPEDVREIAKKHIPSLHASQVTLTSSGNGSYCSLTITFTADNNEQVESLYRELSAHPHTVLVL